MLCGFRGLVVLVLFGVLVDLRWVCGFYWFGLELRRLVFFMVFRLGFASYGSFALAFVLFGWGVTG